MKTIHLFAFSMLLLAACSEQENQNTLKVSVEPISVKTHQLSFSENEEAIYTTGLVTTENEVKYAFKIGGVINQILVEEGQFFEKGTLLASLKTNEIDAGYSQALFGFEKAERDLKRVENLYRDSIATLEQYQNAKTGFSLAQKQLEAVAFDKEYTKIFAKNKGFVTRKLSNTGEIVAGGMPILVVNELEENSWLLKVGLSDKDWAKIQLNNKVRVVLDAYPSLEIEGFVYRKSQAADMNSGSFQIEVKLKIDALVLAVGMFGSATIYTGSTQKFYSLPYGAIVEADGKSAFVFVPNEDGSVQKQAVIIESFDNLEVRIKKGLENVKEVVLTNTAFLNEQSTITIINP
ncbi:MAG: efflux RND transporter periplasmic adaptor subunit [Luteibaculaceae bacterium]